MGAMSVMGVILPKNIAIGIFVLVVLAVISLIVLLWPRAKQAEQSKVKVGKVLPFSAMPTQPRNGGEAERVMPFLQEVAPHASENKASKSYLQKPEADLALLKRRSGTYKKVK